MCVCGGKYFVLYYIQSTMIFETVSNQAVQDVFARTILPPGLEHWWQLMREREREEGRERRGGKERMPPLEGWR